MTAKYRTFLDYLQINDPDFAEFIEENQVDNLLMVGRNKGMTLLLPSPKSKARTELLSLANSDKDEDVDLFVDKLSAMILVDCIKTPRELMEKRDDIPNMLDQRLEIAKMHGNDIFLANGSSISVDPNFQDGSKKQNLAVWLLKGNTLPVDWPKATKKYLKKTDKKNDEQSKPKTNIRQKIATEVENQYMNELYTQMQYGQKSKSNAYLDCVLSIVGFMIKRGYKDILHDIVIPMMCFDKSDFYVLIEPYKACAPYVIPDYLLIEWHKSKKSVNYGNTLNYINSMIKTNEMFENIDKARISLSRARIAPHNIATHVVKHYDKLMSMLSKPLQEFYRTGANKLYEDEFRYTIFKYFDALENKQYFDRNVFNATIEMVRSYTEGINMRPRLFKDLKQDLNKNEKIFEIRVFINSTMFFHVPLSEEFLKEFPLECVLYKPRDMSAGIYNIEEVVRRKCRHLFSEEIKKNELKELINSLKAEGREDEIKSLLLSLKNSEKEKKVESSKS